ncbi:hypothetical protein [Haloferula sp.]|uniref:hypothetical protein n=1 Tax=Haloferula sp. TaxID=2497595 RepID=UPI00329FF2E7
MNNRTASIGILALALAAGTASAQTTVIGGSTGNADFQATTTYSGNTAPFEDTAGWVNLGGGESGTNFGANNQLNASPDPAHDPKQGAFLNAGSPAANTTGYTIMAAGEVFSASFFLAGTGGTAGYGDADPDAPGNGNLDDETVEVFLFTAPAAVDEDTTVGDITKLNTVSFDLDRLSFTTETAPGIYTSTAGDIGKTVYFGIELLNPTGSNPFPRIDVASLEYELAVTDPTITIVSEPFLMNVLSPPGTATSTFTIRNDSGINALEVNSFTPPAGTGFTVISPAPGTPPLASVAVGAELEITVQWDSTAASASYETGDLLINTNDPNTPAAPVTVSGGTPTSFADVLDNGDFETPGTSPGDDEDTFANWNELDDRDNLPDTAPNDPTSVLDVPSFAPSSGTACYFLGGDNGSPAGGTIEAPLDTELTNAVITCDFAFAEPIGINTRKLGFVVDSGAGDDFTQVVIRYYGGAFQARGGVDTGNAWFDVLTDADMGGALDFSIDVGDDGDLNTPGDTIVYYKMILNCVGWGTPNPHSVLEIQDSSGSTLGMSEPFTLFNGGDAPTDPATRIANVEFNAAFNNHPRSWVDNVVVNGSAFDLPTPESFAITAFTIDPATGIGSVTFDSTDGVPYELHASDDLGQTDPFSGTGITNGTGNGTGASTTFNFTDSGTSGQPTRIYRIFTP